MAADNNKKTGQKTDGRLIAADFFNYTFRAILIGLVASVVLGGAVILIAQSTSQDDTNLNSDAPAIKEAP